MFGRIGHMCQTNLTSNLIINIACYDSQAAHEPLMSESSELASFEFFVQPYQEPLFLFQPPQRKIGAH
jgi:hypothetical protein